MGKAEIKLETTQVIEKFIGSILETVSVRSTSTLIGRNKLAIRTKRRLIKSNRNIQRSFGLKRSKKKIGN